MNMYDYNPYYPFLGTNQQAQPNRVFNQPSTGMTMPMGKQEVVRVNGKNGAEAYQMPPNSSILLLDETNPIVWLKTTDGAGYPTLTPYDIAPHQEAQPQFLQVDTQALEKRISRLEEIVGEQFSQSDTGGAQSNKRVTNTANKKSRTD